MSIQPSPQGGKYKYRVNPYNLREIDKKPNRKGGRWERHMICVSAESARSIILKLAKEGDSDE